jgi:ribosomal protein S17E
MYKAVKNYLVNDLNIKEKVDKTYIESIIEKYVANFINKMFEANSSTIDRIIRSEIANVINNGDNTALYSRRSFHSIIVEQIERTVKEEVKSRLKIGLTFDDQLLEKTKEDV